MQLTLTTIFLYWYHILHIITFWRLSVWLWHRHLGKDTHQLWSLKIIHPIIGDPLNVFHGIIRGSPNNNCGNDVPRVCMPVHAFAMRSIRESFNLQQTKLFMRYSFFLSSWFVLMHNVLLVDAILYLTLKQFSLEYIRLPNATLQDHAHLNVVFTADYLLAEEDDNECLCYQILQEGLQQTKICTINMRISFFLELISCLNE